MTPNPKLPTPLHAQIARQMALVNSPAMQYLNSPAFAYMRSPSFRMMTENIRLAHELAKPHMLAMQAFEAQRHQGEVMTREIASWRRQPVAPVQEVETMPAEDAEVVWSTYAPDPNFGFRQNRFEASE